MSTTETSSAGLLPPDDPQRTLLHNEVHARPPARIRLPALVSYVAVFHEGLTREQECEHLRRLPGHPERFADITPRRPRTPGLVDKMPKQMVGEVTEMLSRQRGVLQLVEWVVVDLDDRRDEVIEFD